MTATYPEARDEIFAQFNSAWSAANIVTASILSYVPVIYWQGDDEPDEPPVELYYVRFSTRTGTEKQASFGKNVSGVGKSRYNNDGMFFANIHVPLLDTEHMEKGTLLSVVARDAFRGKTTASGVLFQDVVIIEFSVDNKFFNFQVEGRYHYEDIG